MIEIATPGGIKILCAVNIFIYYWYINFFFKTIERRVGPSWKKFSENFLKFTEIYLNHIWKIAYYHFVPLNQFWTHFSNIAELSEKSELFWICLKNLNCFENCWNSLNSICIVLKQSELFWILLKQSELFWILLKQSELF